MSLTCKSIKATAPAKKDCTKALKQPLKSLHEEKLDYLPISIINSLEISTVNDGTLKFATLKFAPRKDECQ